jgi:thiamine-monophosphate kinase
MFFAHSLTVPEGWDLDYIGRLSDGIAGIITACNGFFAGGDLGTSPRWGFTGVAFGKAERVLTREGARPGDLLYLSGPAGAGNFEAASMLCDGSPEVRTLIDAHRVEFPLRLDEARVMSACASACIDTSDGLLNALTLLADINGCGFQADRVPYFPPGVTLTRILGLPVEILMAGECGEYELLCTVPPEHEPALLEEARRRQLTLHRIGRMTERGRIVMTEGERRIDAGDFALSARAYANHEEYLGVLTHYLNEQLRQAR